MGYAVPPLGWHVLLARTPHSPEGLHEWGMLAFHCCFRTSINPQNHSHHPRGQHTVNGCLSLFFESMHWHFQPRTPLGNPRMGYHGHPLVL